MAMDEKLERLGLISPQRESLGRLLGDSPPHLAMVFLVALAQIVQQQRQVERGLILELSVNLSRKVAPLDKARRFLDGADAMLVHGVFMVLIQLQQAARVRKRRDDFLERAQFV